MDNELLLQPIRNVLNPIQNKNIAMICMIHSDQVKFQFSGCDTLSDCTIMKQIHLSTTKERTSNILLIEPVTTFFFLIIIILSILSLIQLQTCKRELAIDHR